MSLPLVAGALAATVVFYWLVVPARLRAGVLLALSVGALAWVAPTVAGAFLALVVLAWLLAPRASLFAALALVALLAFFKLVNPVVALVPPGAGWSAAVPIGLSYVVFRLISYCVDVDRGTAPRGTLAEVALYALFLPTLLAGPVDRFGRIAPQLAAPAFDLARLQFGAQRVVLGLAKKGLLADPLADALAPLYADPAATGPLVLLASAPALAAQVYLDFSGYTDLAVGLGALFGLQITENFDRPWLATSVADFWRRWHISVMEFIRDYVFLPVFAYRPRPWKVRLGLFATLFLFMIWHGPTWSFVLLGVWHGGAMVVWQLTQDAKRTRPGLRTALASPSGRWASRLLTLTWVSVSFLAFELDLGALLGLPPLLP